MTSIEILLLDITYQILYSVHIQNLVLYIVTSIFIVYTFWSHVSYADYIKHALEDNDSHHSSYYILIYNITNN